MPRTPAFAHAFEAARTALHLTQKRVAELQGVSQRTVERWVLRQSLPPLEDRLKLLQTFRDAPRPLLEALARASGTTLAAAGFAPPPPSPPAAAPTPASSASGPTVQRAIDTAVRELADDLDLPASAVRPALSRFLSDVARAGASIDAASRMVLETVVRAPRGKPPAARGPAR